MKIIHVVLLIIFLGGIIIIGYFLSNTRSDEMLDLSSWAKTYGTAVYDDANSIVQTSDGGYIMVGFTASASSIKDVDSFRVIKLKSDGKIAWQKTYGGAVDNEYFIHQTTDGGYIVAGETACFGAGNLDAWIIKLNKKGKIEWQKTYGGAGADGANSIGQTNDGGYIVAGYTTSFGAGGNDFWVLKLNSDGSIAWQKAYGGASDDIANSIQQTSDGGYILAGWTVSFGAGMADFLVIKLNSDGRIMWQKTYGGAAGDWARSIQETKDFGYIVSGTTMSFGAGSGDIWLIKLNSDGTIIWQKAYGGKGDDGANSMQQTNDEGYIVAGSTMSFGVGNYDDWVLKLNSDGMIEWQKTYGGADGDWGISVQQTKDGGYIVAGESHSFESFSRNSDAWVLRLKKDEAITFNTASKAITTDTTITPIDTRAIAFTTTTLCTDTNVTPKDTNIVPLNSKATINTQAP